MKTPQPEDQRPPTAFSPDDIYGFLSDLYRKRTRYLATGSSEPVRIEPSSTPPALSSASSETRRSSACSFDFDSARSLSSMSSVSLGPQLPCEFVGYYDCEETFDLNTIDDWVDHICDHLNWRLPRDCVCWFCDAAVFHAVDDTPDELERNFRARMHHIAHHFSHDATIAHIRPDFYLLDHLRETGLIAERDFRTFKDWHEAPQPKGGINSEEPAPSTYDRGVAVEIKTRRGRERWQLVRRK